MATTTNTVNNNNVNGSNRVQMASPAKDKGQTHTERLLQSQQEFAQKQKNPRQQNLEFQKAQYECEEKLKKKLQEIEHLKQTDKVLKFITEHINTAERKADTDTELTKEKRKYYRQLKKNLHSLTGKWQKLKDHTEANCIYSPFYDEVLNQYRQEVQVLRSTQVNQKAKLNMLTTEMEETAKQIQDMEKEWDEIQTAASEKAALLAKVKSATYDLSQNLWDMGTDLKELIKMEAAVELLDKTQEFACDLKPIWEKVSAPKEPEPEPEKEVKAGKGKKGKKGTATKGTTKGKKTATKKKKK